MCSEYEGFRLSNNINAKHMQYYMSEGVVDIPREYSTFHLIAAGSFCYIFLKPLSK